ncbi:MAG TPA: hypothetical protein VJ975_03645 [Candidatus Limnocylindria bacterium]|nr:hypothetical protein [Candidatus Limnocylindria bacterium]
MSVSEKKPATHLATAVPGALGAALLIGAVAFGASSLRSAANHAANQAGQQPAASAAVMHEVAFGANVANERRDAFKPDPKPHPAKGGAPATETKTDPPKDEPVKTDAPKPAEQPKTEPTAKPKPVETTKPVPTQKPAPAQGVLALQGWPKDSRAKLSWTAFGGEGFEYYKVVRSGDTMITWPTTADDVLAGVISDRNSPFFADKPPCGTPWSYAVFAVRHGESGYVVLAVSNVVTVTTTCAPAPEPIVVKPIALSVNVLPGQGIQLSWEGCWSDKFVAYKVVRSSWNPDPRFPLNDGAELIGVIGDPNQTGFVDTSVAAGQTWTYRVLAVTNGDGGYVPICETAAMAATAQ